MLTHKFLQIANISVIFNRCFNKKVTLVHYPERSHSVQRKVNLTMTQVISEIPKI